MFNIYIIITAVLLDMLLGDPHNMPHPIRLIGNGIVFFEKLIRKVFKKSKLGELLGGTMLVIIITLLTASISLGVIYIAKKNNIWLYYVLNIWLCYRILAMKSLKVESMKVYNSLIKGDVESARLSVAMIVGRDTDNLDENGIIKATVETVAENSSDGVIAPIIYILLGGPVLGFIYKAVNTMDSMIGYKNEQYMYFGKVAARLDDCMNFIPSRVAGVLIVLAAFLLRLDCKNAFKIFIRDRKKHKSPNSAQTEAACAGALRVALAGDAWYFGKLYKKDIIGDDLRKIEAKDIVRANRLMYTAVWTLLVIIFILKLLVIIGKTVVL